MPLAVHLEGNGVAALCCAHLLSLKNIPVTSSGVVRSGLPAVLLNNATCRLFGDVVPHLDLLSGSHPVRTRVVQWGPNAAPVRLPHAGIVLSEQSLLQRLSAAITATPPIESPRTAIWQVFCASPHNSQTRLNFGTRLAHLAPVTLHAAAGLNTCWVESHSEGWLFLLPTAAASATLIATGPDPQQLLKQSKLIAPLVDSISSPFILAPAYPRIADPLYGTDWLACGSAALAFDPLCGEGTGHAVREAILTSAVLARLASAAGHDPLPLLEHFRQRLLTGFRKHLETCRAFYQSGGNSPWWTGELAQLDAGLRWTAEQLLPAANRPRFRLVDFDLQPCA